MVYKYNVKMEDGVLRVYRERTIADKLTVKTMQEAALAIANLAFEEQKPTELFVIMLLDSNCSVLGIAEVSRGNMQSALVPVGLVIQYATQTNAQGIICAHNHPSNSMTPSEEDKDVSKRLQKACGYCDICMLDSFIVTKEYVVSIDSGSKIRRKS